MAITAAAMRTAIRNELYGADVTTRPYETVLVYSIDTDTQVLLTVPDGAAWAAGDILEIDSEGELCLVTSVAGAVLTVKRAYGGTTASAYVALGSLVRKSPKYSIPQIDQAIQHVLQDLAPEVYLPYTISLTFDSTTTWYPFTTAGDDQVFDVITVYYDPTDGDQPQAAPVWQFQRDVPSAGFTKTLGLVIPASINLAASASIYVNTKKEILLVTELPDRMKSMVIMGAVYSLLGGGDIRRIHDPGKRTDRTVQPGSEARTSIWYLREYTRRYQKIAADLREWEGTQPMSRVAQRARRFRV
jgi:hypothetical protein